MGDLSTSSSGHMGFICRIRQLEASFLRVVAPRWKQASDTCHGTVLWGDGEPAQLEWGDVTNTQASEWDITVAHERKTPHPSPSSNPELSARETSEEAPRGEVLTCQGCWGAL